MDSQGSIVRSLADQADLGLLFQQEEGFLLRMFERRLSPALRKRVGPETLLQDTYLKVQQSWPKVLETAQSPKHALYRAAKECLVETWRKHTRQRNDVRVEAHWPDHASEELCSVIAASLTSPSEAVRRKEIVAVIREVVAQLDEIDREVLELRYYEGLKYDAIADLLGVTKNTAMQRHSRALKRIPVKALKGLLDT